MSGNAKKSLSSLLILMLVFGLCMPAVYGASNLEVQYDATKGTVTGSVYSAVPNPAITLKNKDKNVFPVPDGAPPGYKNVLMQPADWSVSDQVYKISFTGYPGPPGSMLDPIFVEVNDGGGSPLVSSAVYGAGTVTYNVYDSANEQLKIDGAKLLFFKSGEVTQQMLETNPADQRSRVQTFGNYLPYSQKPETSAVLAPGRYDVAVSVMGYTTKMVQTNVEVTAGGTTNLPPLLLNKDPAVLPRTVSSAVYAADGVTVIPGIEINYFNSAGMGQLQVWKTGAPGNYDLSQFLKGDQTVTLNVYVGGYVPHLAIGTGNIQSWNVNNDGVLQVKVKPVGFTQADGTAARHRRRRNIRRGVYPIRSR